MRSISILFICCALSFADIAASKTTTFTEQAWQKITPTYQQINKLAFNQELISGTLDKSRHQFFIEQDDYYLTIYAEVLQLLAEKFPDKSAERMLFQKLAKSAIAERRALSSLTVLELSPATLAYTGYLSTLAHTGTKEELAAAILPCPWIYQHFATEHQSEITKENPYYSWFNYYNNNPADKQTLQQLLQTIDGIAAKTSPATQQKMLQSFQASALLEWHFWRDAYEKLVLRSPVSRAISRQSA